MQAFHAVDGVPPPSSLGPGARKVAIALGWLAVHVTVASRYPAALVVTSKFTDASPVVKYAALYVRIASGLCRQRCAV